jgi:DNA-directed RNA polymerase subunit RPC12/RpoP
MVWWKCEKGHSWKAKVLHRANDHGCPYCSGKLATKEHNLEIFNPGLAKQWHPTKNGNLTPGKVTPQSGIKVWWRCKKDHEWQSIVRKKNNKCPYCNKRSNEGGRRKMPSGTGNLFSQ